MLGFSRQAVYQAEKRKITRSYSLEQALNFVVEVRRRLPKLGTRKLYCLLKEKFLAAHIKLGRDGLFALLKSRRMLIKPMRSYTKTTFSKHWMRKHPNLYTGRDITRSEEVFVSDITYLRTRNEVCYLSLVTDAFSRKITGYHLSRTMTAEDVVKALDMTIKNRISDNPAIHHSDRGLQYASRMYQKTLNAAKITPSMTDGYDCYQNALAERVNGILKQEFLFKTCNTFKELQQMVKDSIRLYNEERPHTALGMKTPFVVHEKSL